MIFVLLAIIIIGNLIWFSISLYRYLTIVVPAEGGQYIEAIAGQPRHVNPLLASSPADFSLVKLIYSGLFDYDSEGNIVSDLAESYEKSDDFKEYTIHLRQNVKWHDEKTFSAEDVIFTVNLIKNKDYEGLGFDNLRLAFDNVDKVEKQDDFTVKFVLKESQEDFLYNLTIGILPQHAWSQFNQENFTDSKLNQNPIGTGPFLFVSRDEGKQGVSSYTLRSYQDYHQGKPLIKKMILKFYPTQEHVVEAYKNGEVMAVILDKSEDVISIKNEDTQKAFVDLPIYFSTFFNQTKSVVLAYDEVREALSLATDRNEIVKQVTGGLASPMNSPLFEGTFGYSDEFKQKDFNLEEANKILEEKGWKIGEDGIRKKGDNRLEFSLHINSGQSFHVEVAKVLQEQWKKIGVDVKVVEHDRNEFKGVLDSRDFDAVMEKSSSSFSNPNLLSLWNSKSSLNLAKVKSDSLDNALSDLKKENDEEKRKELYSKIQKEIDNENLVLFLFSPRLAFVHSDDLRGFKVKKVNDVNGYYFDIQHWYLKEKRIWKKD